MYRSRLYGGRTYLGERHGPGSGCAGCLLILAILVFGAGVLWMCLRDPGLASYALYDLTGGRLGHDDTHRLEPRTPAPPLRPPPRFPAAP